MRVIRCCKSKEIGEADNPQVLLIIFIYFERFSSFWNPPHSEYKIKNLPLRASHLQIAICIHYIKSNYHSKVRKTIKNIKPSDSL